VTTANVNVTKILHKRGNTTQNDNYTGVFGEISVDTQVGTIRVHDGSTAGGTRLATYSELTDLATGNLDLSGYATSAGLTAANVEIGKLRANITAANAAIVSNYNFLLANAGAAHSEINGVRANITAANVAWTANAATQATAINSINANLGSFQTYANATFTGGGGSTYSNTNVAAFLGSVTGNIIPNANAQYSLGSSTHWWRDIYVGSNTIYLAGVPLSIDANGDLLVDGNVVQGGNVDLTAVNANITAANSSIQTTNANIGAYQIWANANAAAQTTSINTTNANIGAYQTWANANAAAQTTSINTTNANIGAYQTWANANFGTSNYANANVASYLPTYTGNIAVGNIVTAVDTNLTIATSQTLTTNNSYTNTTDFSTDVEINGSPLAGWYQRNSEQIEFALFGPSVFQTYLLGLALGRTVIVTYSTGSGNQTLTRPLTQRFSETGQTDPANPTWGRVSGRIDATLPEDQTGIVSINFPEYSVTSSDWMFSQNGNLRLPTNGIITYANGVNILSTVSGSSTYSNANVAAYLPTYTGNLTAGNATIGTYAPGNYGLHTTGSSLAVGMFNTSSLTVDSAGNLLLGGTGHVRITGASGSTVTIGGGSSGNVYVPGGIVFNDGTQQTSAYTGYGNASVAAYLTGEVTAGNITVGNITVETNAVVLGNLRVAGTQTTVNATTLSVDDLWITVADGATQASDANGAGLRVAGANANISYSSVRDSFEFNKSITVGNVIFSNNTRFFNNNVTLPNGQGFNWHFYDPMIGGSTTSLYYNGLVTGFDSWVLETGNGTNAWMLDSDTQEFYLFNGAGDGKLVFGTASNAGTGSINDIELKSTSGNVYITANAEPWTFREDGNLLLPNNMIFTSSPAVSGTGIIFGDGTYQRTAAGLPDRITDGTQSVRIENGDLIIPHAIKTPPSSYYIATSDTSAEMSWGNSVQDPNTNVYSGFYASPGGAFIENATANSVGNWISQTWTFGFDGNLTIPGNINFANGVNILSTVTGGGNVDLGKFKIVTDSGVAILTTTDDADGYGGYDISITPSEMGSAFIRVPNNANAELGQSLTINSLEANSSVQINTDWSDPWIFGADGTLTLPGAITVDTTYNSLEAEFDGGAGEYYLIISKEDWPTANVEIQAGDIISKATDPSTSLVVTGAVIDSGIFWNAPTGNNYIAGGTMSFNLSRPKPEWQFNANSTIILPPGGDILDSNGASVLGVTTNRLVNSIYELALQANGAVSIPGSIVAQSTDPASYRGFYATVNQISEQDSDPSLNQIILSRSATMRGYDLSDDTNNDTFFANGITGSSHVAVINLYGSNYDDVMDLADIKTFVQTYIDLVLFDGPSLRTDVADIQTAFAAAQTDLIDSLPANALRSNFKFNEIQAVINTAGMTRTGTGSGFVYYYNNDTRNYSSDEETTILVPGTGYQVGDTITVPGTVLGGIAPDDNMTIAVAGVDGSGGITDVNRSGSMASSRFANLFVKHSIDDGIDDAYDQGNYIGTDRSECVFTATANAATERITVSAVTSGELAPFKVFGSQSDDEYNYLILHQVSGTTGGTGVYALGGYSEIGDEATAKTYTANGIYYAINDPQYNSDAFGGGDYVGMVNTSVGIFTMVAVNADIDRISYLGTTGADGDGIKTLTSNFDIGTGVVEYPGIELTVDTNTWTFENTGNLILPQTSNVGITFSDGTFQKTAYKRPDNLMLDGGGAATIYEVTVDYAEGGFSSTRYGVNTPSFNGGGAELEEAIYYTLDGGGA